MLINGLNVAGEKGASGMAFCAPDDRDGDCYEANFDRIDCDQYPNHSRCIGFEDRNGLIFCDVQYQDIAPRKY